MRISTVIVNWNARDLLRVCLVSLEKELEGIESEVFVVDNASTDGSSQMIRLEFPRVKLVENAINVGFPRANNQVLGECRGEYVLLLNPDTEVRPGGVTRMMEFLDRESAYGACGPRLLLPDGSIQLECARRLPTLQAMVFEQTLLSRAFPGSRLFGQWKMSYWDHRDSRDVECLLGAAILLRRSVLEAIGPMDEHMYMEDLDLCCRVLKAGRRIRYLADAEICHYDGASRRSSRRFYHHYQIAWHGLWRYFLKHGGPWHALAFRLVTMVCSAAGSVAFLALSAAPVFGRDSVASFRDRFRKSAATLKWSLTPPRRFIGRY